MKNYLIIASLLLFTCSSFAQKSLQNDIAIELHSLFKSESQQISRVDRNGRSYFHVEDIRCINLGSESLCLLADSPSNENVVDFKLQGNSAVRMIGILNRIKPSSPTTTGMKSLGCVVINTAQNESLNCYGE